jgi:hypothetical protein
MYDSSGTNSSPSRAGSNGSRICESNEAVIDDDFADLMRLSEFECQSTPRPKLSALATSALAESGTRYASEPSELEPSKPTQPAPTSKTRSPAALRRFLKPL